MIIICCTKINSRLDNIRYLSLLSNVSNSKRTKIKKFIRQKDSERVLVADILARYQICCRTGLMNKEIRFNNNKYGKPYLEKVKNIHFNISHSDKWVVCVTADKPVGIDIEKIKEIDFGIAKRFFSKIEYKELEKRSGKDKLHFFYDLWTLKESYIKAVGKGLSIPLNSFSVRVNRFGATIQGSSAQNRFFLGQFNIDQNYKMAVCFQNDDVLSTLSFLSFHQLYQGFMKHVE